MGALNTVGGRLMLARKNKGWTQPELLEQLRLQHGQTVTQSHWSRVECNERGVSLQLLIAVADLLGVSLDYLTGRKAKRLEHETEVEYAA